MAENKETKRLTKAELIQVLATNAGVQKTVAKNVLDVLAAIAEKELLDGKDFVLPGIVRLSTKDRAATKERVGVNPFTKKPMTIPAKPASRKVRAAAVRALKQLVKQ